ncbi:hypothetical protein [Bdellovibrio bacteriovorus]|uniref:Uncharacterized protein n=1 Tax=Bdellovibrio bacteriovorus TaxID=959 RepID=A0A150WKJ1_BDEBC|nr:hypothetical protein [Bdellovibrio bacteriovorus]KYG62563.1 hypothetical protein AZI87_14770 [Bdellovibrio bacteriovorus]KYG64416.1 hypothetical protein AZI85_03065 [Bdellovibrio bacteriovorus]
MIRVFLVLFLLSSLVGFKALAQEASAEPQYDEAREAELAQKAKKRIYPGGRDEEDLKVQSQLTTPVRKLAPQAEVKEEATEE